MDDGTSDNTSHDMPDVMTDVRAETGGRRRQLRLAGVILCGVLLLGPALVVVVRIGGLDDGTALALPIAGLQYAALLTLALLAALAALRTRWLAGAAAVLAALQLWWLVPRMVDDGNSVPAAAPRLRIATNNAYLGQVSPQAVVDLVRSQRVDVLAMEELSGSAAAALDRAGIRELLPYREMPDHTDTAIYSRLPVTSAGDPVWPQTNITVTVGGRNLQIVAVHTYYPLGDAEKWADLLHRLRAAASGRTHDTVVLGDFNATVDHKPMRDLMATGLTDTHAELGQGVFPTWPEHNADFPYLPPLIQIDHVLHGDGLVAVSVGEHTLPRSDHRAVVAELALR